MNRKKLLVFLILTFLWSWILWIIGLNYLSDGINQESIGKFLVFFFVGIYGPTISGIITTLFYDGLKGLFELIKKVFIWKVPLINYIYIILLPLIFVIIGIALYSQFIGEIGDFDKMAFLSIPTILLAGLYAGPLGEELGWRGFLLPELQKKYTNLKSAIIIGFIWFIWHIPLWWAPFGTLVSGESISFLPVITYFLMLMCLSIIITWLVINSKGSVLVAILFHLSINAGIALLFFPELSVDFKKVHLLSSIGMLIFTGILIYKNKLKTSANNGYM
ncbi:MAG: CPBP family glutamic-type intramembrane protease [Flavobacteriia bacterium]|nr:CPBP family glutamic-type intramembrane protease [Flavobacteriia bacterium]